MWLASHKISAAVKVERVTEVSGAVTSCCSAATAYIRSKFARQAHASFMYAV